MVLTTWKDESHPNLTQYWEETQAKWIDDYKKNRRDYVKEMFLKLVGNNFYRFLLSYNKRMKADIDSVTGLSDFLFTDANNNGCKEIAEVFFHSNGFSLGDTNDTYGNATYRYTTAQPYRRTEEVMKYFNTRTYHYFNDLDTCKDFQFRRKFRYSICDLSSSRYSHGNPIINDMDIIDEMKIDEILSNVRICAKHQEMGIDDVIDMVNIDLAGYYIRFDYQKSQVNKNLPAMHISVDSDNLMGDDGYNNLYRLVESNKRCIFIKVNQPIFSDAMCKFFHFLEKIHSYPNEFEKDYMKIFSPYKPETQFLEQICLKCLFLDNPTIQGALEYLNTTKPRSFHYIPDSNPIAVYCEWIRAGGTRGEYDRYSNNPTFNIAVMEHFPMWLDLKYKSFLENMINMHDYGPIANETLEHQNDRDRHNHYMGRNLDAIIDNCNLKRESLFQSFVSQFKQ